MTPPRSPCCQAVRGAYRAVHTVLRSGNTGRTVRPKVELVTIANDAYHAAIAVARPTQPPRWIVVLEPFALPMPSRKKVAVSRAKTRAIAAVVRSDATSM